MDWKDGKGRALLWRAYPSGYLAMRGVLTLGGWQFVSMGNTPACPQYMDDPSRVLGQAAGRGDLLPLPDPVDLATWACLKADLAKSEGRFDAIGWAGETPGKGTWSWSHDEYENSPDRRWRLEFHPFDIDGWISSDESHRGYDIDTDNPAEALIRARIQLREVK